MGNTALSNYIVDSYYEHAMDIITFYSVLINVSNTFLKYTEIVINIIHSFRHLLSPGSSTYGLKHRVSRPHPSQPISKSKLTP